MMQYIKKCLNSLLSEGQSITNPETQTLRGCVAVISGGSKGIGKAIAQALYNDGAMVIILARNKESFDKAFKNFSPQRIAFYSVDITDEFAVQHAVANIVRKHKKIDVLVNNAGMFIQEKFIEDVSLEEFRETMLTNLEGMFLLTRAIVPYMKKQKDGTIINIGSKISHNTNVEPKKIAYTTSKYAVEGFSLALRKEVKQFGIRVTCIMPGTARTFVSFKSKEYLSPLSIGFLVATIAKSKDVDFESVIISSKEQNL